MQVKKVFLFIFFMYLAGFLLHAVILKKTVYGDGIYYYAWLRSVVVDHDLDFGNDYTGLGVSQPETVTGRVRNIYSIGPALLWLPGYTIVHSVVRGTGFEFVYHLSTGLLTVFYVFTGIVLVFRLVRTHFSEHVSLYTILAVSLATNLFYYGSVDTINSHGLTFFAAAYFLSVITSSRWFASGVAYGIIGLIRMQDLIYGLFFLPVLVKAKKTHMLIGLILTILPQLFLWKVFGGSFATSPYFGEKLLFFRPFEPKIVEILFSPLNGLFLWTPVLLYALAGFLINGPLNRQLRQLYFSVFLLQLYIVSVRNEWWQEASYSGRMFTSILPLFALGIAQSVNSLLKSYKQTTLATSLILFSVLNIALIVFYLLIH